MQPGVDSVRLTAEGQNSHLIEANPRIGSVTDGVTSCGVQIPFGLIERTLSQLRVTAPGKSLPHGHLQIGDVGLGEILLVGYQH